jgi:hypothetical protein
MASLVLTGRPCRGWKAEAWIKHGCDAWACGTFACIFARHSGWCYTAALLHSSMHFPCLVMHAGTPCAHAPGLRPPRSCLPACLPACMHAGMCSDESCEAAYFKMNNAVIDDRRVKVDFSQSVAHLWKQFRKYVVGWGLG